jgi:hypothetical protein
MFESLLNRKPNPNLKHKDQNKNLNQLITSYKKDLKVKLPGDFSNNTMGINTLGELLVELGKRKEFIADSILITYWLRNILGHSLAWEDRLDQDAYRKLYQIVMSSCLQVINCLWRNSTADEVTGEPNI